MKRVMLSRNLALILFAVAPVMAQAGGVYWTDRGASQLKRMNFDGSGLQTILLSGAVTSPGSNIRGLAVDNVNNRIFWADNGADRLLRANLDGSGSTILHTIAGGNSFPADVRLVVRFDATESGQSGGADDSFATPWAWASNFTGCASCVLKMAILSSRCDAAAIWLVFNAPSHTNR